MATGKKKKLKLSERQRKMMEYITSVIEQDSLPPTIREIGTNVNISSTSVVNYNLDRLAEKEIDQTSFVEVSRGIVLTDLAHEMFGDRTQAVANKVKEAVQATTDAIDEMARRLVSVPVVGDIVASEPLEVGSDSTFDAQNYDEAVEVSSTMLPSRTQDLYALRVKGDSMIDAMVNEDDIVILQRQEEARNGDMVAVWLTNDDTTTLKYFHNEGEKVRLQPANPTMEPIYVNPKYVQVQ